MVITAFVFNPLIFSQTFTELNLGLGIYSTSHMSFGDFDNDHDLDLLFGGVIYSNNEGTFVNYMTIGSAETGEWGDYNNDGNLDILLTGNGSVSLHRNNGNCTFTKVTAGFTGVAKSSCRFFDYDNDGDLDIIVSGVLTGGDPLTQIYRNDRNDVFTAVSTNLRNLGEGSVETGDFDNDYDTDIFMSGLDISGNPYTRLYKKEKGNLYSEINSGFIDVYRSALAAADYNCDNNLDILASGNWDHSDIYKNNGSNSFANIAAGIIGLRDAEADWGDYDNDGYLDLAVAGASSDSYTSRTKVYRNGRSDTFTDQSLGLRQFQTADIKWCDYDNDTDLDLFIFGRDASSTYRQLLYINNGTALNAKPSRPDGLSYSQYGNGAKLSWLPSTDNETPQAGLTYNIRLGTSPGACDIVAPMSDLTNGYRKVRKPGNAGNGTSWVINNLQPGITYYWSVQAVDNNFQGSEFSAEGSFQISNPFTYIDIGLTSLRIRSFAWGDYDNDNDMDFICCGYKIAGTVPFTYIYRNNGGNSFTRLAFEPFPLNDTYGYVDWFDLDNDNDLDIILIGSNVSKIYRNDGSNIFVETVSGIQGVTTPYATPGDINNDGYTDVLLFGNSQANIYLNNRKGSFIKKQLPIYEYPRNKVLMADFDKDRDMDLVYVDYPYMKIYRNNKGSFEEVANSHISLAFGNMEAADYDNDGLLDILYNGYAYDNVRYTKILKNTGNLTFTDVNANIRGIQEGIATWVDYDNDADLDVLIGGQSVTNLTRLLEQDVTNKYTEMNPGLPDSYQPAAAWADSDGDGDPDLLFNPYLSSNGLWKNNGNWVNNPPTAPANLRSIRCGNSIILEWDPSTDPQGGSAGITYNVRIGTTPGSCNIVSPLSNTTTGCRRINRMGNTQTCTTWRIDSLAQGTYYWSVQAIDHSFKGGIFSPEASFTINLLSADFSAPETCNGNNTVFTDKSINTGSPVISWSWDFGDGQNSSVQNPLHQYAAAGNYQVKLAVRSSESCDSITKIVVVKEKPSAGFTANTVCLGISTIFTNTTMSNGLSITGWSWNFGNGASSSLQNPGTHTYQNPGNYNVSLEASASNGCSSVTEKIVTVGEYPVSTVSADGLLTFCQGDSVILSVNHSSSYQYQWKNYGINITSATASSYKAKSSGVYLVEIINPVGNCKSVSNNLNISVLSSPSPPLISNSGSTSFCQGDSVILTVPNSPGNIYQWKLNGGNTGTNSWNIAAKTSGTYTLKITNSGGCSVESANSVVVNAFPNPVVANLNISGPVSFCEGQNVHLSVTYNSSYIYQWYNNSVRLSGANSNSFLANATGNYSLSVKNSDGCERLSETVNVSVSPFPVKPLIMSENYTEGQCQGETPIILKVDQANPQYTYQWEEDGKLITGATQSQYSGILKSALYSVNVNNNGCTSKSEIKIEVENVRKPSIVAQGPNVWYLACTIDSAAVYKWYFNNNLINGAGSYLYVANQQMGTYMVTVGTKKGCFATSDPLTIPFGNATVIEENIFSGLRIYPNPTPDYLRIEMNNQVFGDIICTIYSEDGSEVMNTIMDKPDREFSTRMDLSSLRNGTYIIMLMINNYPITRKIIVSR